MNTPTTQQRNMLKRRERVYEIIQQCDGFVTLVFLSGETGLSIYCLDRHCKALEAEGKIYHTVDTLKNGLPQYVYHVVCEQQSNNRLGIRPYEGSRL